MRNGEREIMITEIIPPNGPELFNVMQGYWSKEKNVLVNETTTPNKISIQILIAIDALLGSNTWGEDISQAYVQSESRLIGDVYLKPNREL